MKKNRCHLSCLVCWCSELLFAEPKDSYQRHTHNFLHFVLYCLGFSFLSQFLGGNSALMTSNDWIKEYMYLNALRDAQIDGVVPWAWNMPFYHATRKLLSNPEIILTPDIVLLRWVANQTFVMIHVGLFYTFGFLGCRLLARHFRLGLVSFLVLWLLFNMNGFITSHLGIGHLQWASYYLLPGLLFCFLRLNQLDLKKFWYIEKYSVFICFLLFFMFMNGSIHIAVWCLLFMAVSSLWNMRLVCNLFFILCVTGLLGLFRILPAALYFPKSPDFVSGFPSLLTVIEGLTVLRGRHYEALGGSFGLLRWWEYNIYIGFVAFALILTGLIVVVRRRMNLVPIPMIMAGAVLFVLSLGDVYALVPESGVPFGTLIRVSSRLIAIPLIICFLMGALGLDCCLKANRSVLRPVLLVALPFVVFELLTHSSYWSLPYLEGIHRPVTKPSLDLCSNVSTAYRRTIYVSYSISGFSFLGLLLCSWLCFEKKKFIKRGALSSVQSS